MKKRWWGWDDRYFGGANEYRFGPLSLCIISEFKQLMISLSLEKAGDVLSKVYHAKSPNHAKSPKKRSAT